MANNEINADKKYTSNDGDFDGHADMAVQCRVHWPMEHIHGFMQATRCRHCASAHGVLPRRLPWSMILNETKKNTNKTQLLPSFLTVDRRKKAEQFWDLKWTLCSCHRCDKLHTNMKHYCSSWRAQLHFELSNVVNGQKFEKLVTLNEAQKTCGPNMAI